MIHTPLGEIEVKVDGEEANCVLRKLSVDEHCPELDGRYAILVDDIVDRYEHTVSCCIKRYRKTKNDFIEPGERLDLKTFCKGSVRLSIGMFSDIQDEWGESADPAGNYWTEYLNNGVQYHLVPGKSHTVLPFGVAWLDHGNQENDVQTWYGADPTIWWEAIQAEQKVLYSCVKPEIDYWNPYGLLQDAPPDEFDGESRRISWRIRMDSTGNEIAIAISVVFTNAFGAGEGFAVAACQEVAERIARRIAEKL